MEEYMPRNPQALYTSMGKNKWFLLVNKKNTIWILVACSRGFQIKEMHPHLINVNTLTYNFDIPSFSSKDHLGTGTNV